MRKNSWTKNQMKRENVVKKCLMGTKAVSAEGQKKKTVIPKKEKTNHCQDGLWGLRRAAWTEKWENGMDCKK